MRVTVPITTTIYMGLLPTALMRSLRGLMGLRIVFAWTGDRRNVERVVGVLGDEIRVADVGKGGSGAGKDGGGIRFLERAVG